MVVGCLRVSEAGRAQDKWQKHLLLLKFLRRYNVWDVVPRSCRRVLATHGELLRCSAALSVHQGSGSGSGMAEIRAADVVFEAMRAGVEQHWGVGPAQLRKAGLTVQDVFYCQVSRLADVRIAAATAYTLSDMSSLALLC